jgi:hypothetical protein
MDKYFCELCDASFRTRGGLATHRASCIGNKIPKVGSSSRGRSHGRPETPLLEPEIPHDMPGPSEPFPPSEPVQFIVDESNLEDYDDCLDEEVFDLPLAESSTASYNSNSSLIRWIRTVRKSSGLSNTDVDRLFTDVLFHPKFKLEDVTVKSGYDIDKYERSYYSKEDGWKSEDIGEFVLRYRDPLNALEYLFSSPTLAENFTLKPSVRDDEHERVYSTPATGDWWHSMQARI